MAIRPPMNAAKTIKQIGPFASLGGKLPTNPPMKNNATTAMIVQIILAVLLIIM